MNYDDILKVEDDLQEFGVYRSMFDNKPRHMDSYGTLTDYKLLQEWWNENKDRHTKEEWNEVIKYEQSFAYLSPNASQLASFILRNT